MNYFDFLKRVIDDGIEAAKKEYANRNDKSILDGSLAGFEACRDKSPAELIEVYNESLKYKEAMRDPQTHWWFRGYQLEVEFVCNVVSAILVNEGGQPLLSHLPTARGYMKAASILNQ